MQTREEQGSVPGQGWYTGQTTRPGIFFQHALLDGMSEGACASVWRLPRGCPGLERGVIHVWRAFLPQTRRRDGLLEILGPEERERAKRFRLDEAREAYIVRRGLLRVILAGYLGIKPGGLRYSQNAFGKPALRDRLGGDRLCFNVSRSGRVVLCAFARDCEVGVDVEEVRHDIDHEEIAARFFAPEEVAALQACAASERREAFFKCWTRKEAYVKATGEGLSLPLHDFAITQRPGQKAMRLRRRGVGDESSRWWVSALDPGPGYVGAVAAQAPWLRLTCLQWQ